METQQQQKKSLEEVCNEIIKLLNDNDMAGVGVFQDQETSGLILEVSPSWSCTQVKEGEGLIVKDGTTYEKANFTVGMYDRFIKFSGENVAWMITGIRTVLEKFPPKGSAAVGRN